MIVYIYNIGVDLYNGFNGLRHRINWTYFTVLDGLAHPLYSLSDFLYEFSIQNPNELSVYLRKLEREGVQLLDITNTSDDLENMYTRIYGE